MRKFPLGECNAASMSSCLMVSAPQDPDLHKLLGMEMFTCWTDFRKERKFSCITGIFFLKSTAYIKSCIFVFILQKIENNFESPEPFGNCTKKHISLVVPLKHFPNSFNSVVGNMKGP